MTRAATTLADPVRALQGATSYWAFVVVGPPRHMSHSSAHGTDVVLVTLGRSARPGSLHQGRPGSPDGTGCGACGSLAGASDPTPGCSAEAGGRLSAAVADW